MQTHLALMQALAALHGAPSGRILNTPASNGWPNKPYSPPTHSAGYNLHAGIGSGGALPPAPNVDPGSELHYEDPGQADGGYNWASRSFTRQLRPNAQSLAQALLSATRNPNYSHQQAMSARFLQNRGVQ